MNISILNNDAGYISANDATTLSAINVSTFNNDAGYLTSDEDTTYTLSMSDNRITLTPSSGSATYVDLPVYNGGVS